MSKTYRPEITLEFLHELKGKAEKATPGPWCTCLTAEKVLGRKHPDWGCIYANVQSSKTGEILEGCHLLRVNSNLMSEEEANKAREMFFDEGIQTNPGLMGANAEYIAVANPSVMLALIERIEELEANNYGPEILNDPQALTVSYFAGRMAEGRENNAEIDRLNAEIERLQKECDAHIKVARDFKRITTNLANEIDENDEIADEEEARLEKEADWLATELAKFCSRMVCYGCPHGASLEGNTQLCEILSFDANSPQTWRNAARKAVKKNKD